MKERTFEWIGPEGIVPRLGLVQYGKRFSEERLIEVGFPTDNALLREVREPRTAVKEED